MLPSAVSPVPEKISWSAALLGGCVAVAGGAFFGTLIATVSIRLAMILGYSVQQATMALMVPGINIVTGLGTMLNLLSGAAGGYVAAKYGNANLLTQSAAASVLPLLFMAVMYLNPGSQFGPDWYVAYSFLSPVFASVVGGWAYRKRAALL